MSVTVPGGQPTAAALTIPTALDCQAVGGIPALDYNLKTGLSASGKLESSEILFAP